MGTLQQIGDMFGVCRERVRQIEKKALIKLKHLSRLRTVVPDYDKIGMETRIEELDESSLA